METTDKAILNTLVYVAIYLILFVTVLPALIQHLPTAPGRAAYALFVTAGAAFVVRLRWLSRRP